MESKFEQEDEAEKMDASGYSSRFHPPLEKNVGGTQGLNFIFLLLQYPTTLIPAVCLVPAVVIGLYLDISVAQIVATAVAIPIVAVVVFAASLVILSRQYDSKHLVDGAHWNQVRSLLRNLPNLTFLQ